jgi:hypothetical protein
LAALSFLNFFSLGVCQFLLRDANLLLNARKCRLVEDWVGLQTIIYQAECNNNEGSVPFSEWCKLNNNDLQPKLLPVLMEEIAVLKSDSLFHICLCEFANEMLKRDNNVSDENNESDDTFNLSTIQKTRSFDFNSEHIDSMTEILDLTRESSFILYSPEYDRLLEAIQLALELRVFVCENPNRSPQTIIHKVAEIKKRDRANEVPCYVTILICDIAKMQNMLDFPVSLEIIQREINNGQKYVFLCFF